jgi:DnaJ-class molecular chaperone
MSGNYYSVLGVSPSASQEEIKKAYRKCAIACHPDKCFNNPGADDKMKDVNVAFATLSDPHKRLMYDMGMGSDSSEQFDWSVFTTLFAKLVSKMGQQKSNKPKNKVEKNLQIDLVVDMEEVCRITPPIKKISVKVIRCDAGKKKIRLKNRYINLLNYENTYVFSGEGDESLPGVFGDIVVKLVIKPRENYHIDDIFNKYDLYYDHVVNLPDYFYGNKSQIQHIDGESVINIDYTGGMTTIVHKGLGISYVSYVDESTNLQCRGDLYVMFDLKMPTLGDVNNNKTHVLNTDPNFRNILSSLY